MVEKRKRLVSIIISGFLLIGIVTPLITPLFALGATNYSSTLGTNIALGSPLLNESFNNDSWNKWEMVCFGVYLSNFPTPLLDNYNSAFNKSSDKGSKGSKLDTLVFGTGNDPAGNDVLKSMVNTAIQNQVKLYPINVKYKSITNNFEEGSLGTTTRQSNINDFFIDFRTMSDGDSDKPWVKGGTSGVSFENSSNGLDLYSYETIKSANLPVFTIDSGGEEVVIFDYTNSFDAQMAAALVSRLLYDDNFKEICSNLKKLKGANTDLYLDAFGNIVTMLDGGMVIVFPAACNQHITVTPQYNLLNSIVFNNSYSPLDKNDLILNLSTDGNVTGGKHPFNGSTDKIPEGSVVLYYDTDTSIIGKMRDNYRINNSLSSMSDEDVNLGKSIVDLLGSELSDNSGRFRIGVIKGDGGQGFFNWLKEKNVIFNELENTIVNQFRACELIGNYIETERNVPTSVEMMDLTGNKTNLFNSHAYAAVDANSVMKQFINETLLYLDGTIQSRNTQINLLSGNEYLGVLTSKSKASDVVSFLYRDSDSSHLLQIGNLYKRFIFNGLSSGLWKKVKSDGKKLEDTNISKISESNYRALDLTSGNVSNSMRYTSDNDTYTDTGAVNSVGRICKVYMLSRELEIVKNIFGMNPGTEFGSFTPSLYLTYLDWYGVLNSNNSSNFNPKIFKESSEILKIKSEDLFSGMFMSEEEKKQAITDYTLLLLDPTKGKEYRGNIIMSGISEWIYRTYNNIVYNDSVHYSASDSTLSSKSSTGFLKLDSYQDNFMTGWFMERYAQIIIVGLGILLLAIVIIAIITHKTIAWLIVSFLLAINIILVTPAFGEITPYIANNAVQKMFGSHSTYWAMAESIANNKTDSMVAGIGSEYGDVDTNLVSRYTRMLSSLYTDKTLMIKNDISKKINETADLDMNSIQTLQSARWLLPTIMRQFTAEDGSANYIYTTLADSKINNQNLYWRYIANDMLNVQTSRSMDANNRRLDEFNRLTLADKLAIYPDYKSTAPSSIGLDTSDVKYFSNARQNNDEDVPYTQFWILRDLVLPSMTIHDPSKPWSDEDIDSYAINGKVNVDALEFKYNHIEYLRDICAYNPDSLDTVKDSYGYFWLTENTVPYMYQSIKSNFSTDVSMRYLANELQGRYDLNSESNTENRVSFMHYGTTGNIRDFLDMRELFTNVIPYMYKVQLVAGGSDGYGGVFNGSKIGDGLIFKGNLDSWLYRSNWVSKLMEDKHLTAPTTVRDRDNNKYRIENPIIPESYPDARPMIFSEAEMIELGLTEADLSLPELKILRLNRNVEKKWTLMLNYINTADVTPDIFFQQMAIDATIEFNKAFSPDNFINSTKALYPTSIDLRSISFDSVMKLIMLSNTRDSRYIYGDTMKTVIDDSDILTSILLLLDAFLCAYVIPLIRNITLGLIFYLGFWALICNLLAAGKTKLKITTAYMINNIVYLVMTLVFYAVFAVIININTSDSVLSEQNITLSLGVPTWAFLVVLGASLAYMIGSFYLMSFTIKNYRDLGFELYAAWAGKVAGKIQDSFSKVGSSLSDAIGNISNSSVGGSSIGGNSRKRHSEENEDTIIININKNDTNDEDDYMNEILDDTDEVYIDNTDDSKINEEIKKGQQMK